MSHDDYQKIIFREASELWKGGRSGLSAKFFHTGLYFKHALKISEVTPEGVQEVEYNPKMFSGLSATVGELNGGFSGFRIPSIRYSSDKGKGDTCAFLGAAYFRCTGAMNHFGLSARGLSIDTGKSVQEEFPSFIEHWLVEPDDNGIAVVYSLMDSPSATGAFRFEIAPGDELKMTVKASFFLRRGGKSLGIAPLTSMYYRGENFERGHEHDSDGLLLNTGVGEWIWRPLQNPSYGVRVDQYPDWAPQGFGLLQRERNSHLYDDAKANYQLRPGVWIEPIGNWGAGTVKLVEIPTKDALFDNVVAFWEPAEIPRLGEPLRVEYRLTWGSLNPKSQLAKAVRTEIQKEANGAVRYAIQFAGGELGSLSSSTISAVTSRHEDISIENIKVNRVSSERDTLGVSFLARRFNSKAGSARIRLESNERVVSESFLVQVYPE